MDFQALDRNSILEKSVYCEILDIADPSEQAIAEQRLEDRAREIGSLSLVRKTLAGHRALLKKQIKEEREQKRPDEPADDRTTYFTFNADFIVRHPQVEYLENLRCGAWIAGNDGIYSQTSGGFDQIVCRQPITIIGKAINNETSLMQIEIAWARNGIWKSISVPQSWISTASKIVCLSDYGIPVTSENAKPLVRYLAELNVMNEDVLRLNISTSKLGWFNNERIFIPYDKAIEFDGDRQFQYLSSSLHEQGSYEKWISHIKDLRKTGKNEIKIMMASSFASILLSDLNALPFICSLWGDTEGGKTLTLMVAASIWGNPNENHLIGDFKTTETALEVRADLLNHLPMILDDTSKVSKRIAENMEGFVYDMVSGKGKSRSNKDLGARRENTWRNSILVTGERPLSSYVSQGGAINRILEVQCSEHIYDDPQRTARIVKTNYGFAGKMFVDAIKAIAQEELMDIFTGFYKQLLEDKESMEKQAGSMAVVLTADQIADNAIFHDGMTINIEDARKILTRRSDVSDGQRAYEFLIDKINMNPSRFDDESRVEQWGVIETDNDDVQTVFLFPQALDGICKDGGFSRKTLESWMTNRKLIKKGADGKTAAVKKIGGRPKRVITITMTALGADDDGFLSAEDLPEPVFE